MADEPTNINSITEGTVLLHFVDGKSNIREFFLCLVKVGSADAGTITQTQGIKRGETLP
jgi:hypothetical protein